ncbi:FliO/MopB family protein [Desulfatitalea tepidiphila]|uniref:FliO/MopB family protein n=1 Tax=Desulfatitalea tepidiphila TaxID=1185843 RepID=UPI0006B621B9|nr:flagellar biosynthetic protein FliO [Desulfatitalea tepidiphila]
MNEAPDLTLAAIKMVLSLGLVLAILYLAYRWTRRSLPAGTVGGRGRLIQVLGSQYLGVKKSIAVVRVPGNILVLGIGNEQINLLTKIDDPEVMAAFTSESELNVKGGGGFKDQLQRMLRPMQTRCDRGAANDAPSEVSR